MRPRSPVRGRGPGQCGGARYWRHGKFVSSGWVAIIRFWGIGAFHVPVSILRARSEFGDGRLDVVRCAADIPAGGVGGRGKFTALALDADLPALLRKRASGSLGRRLELGRDILTLSYQWVDSPFGLSGTGHRVLSAAHFGEAQEKSLMGPTHLASFLDRDFSGNPLNSPNRVLRFPYEEG